MKGECQCDAEEHEEMYECKNCGACIFGDMMFKEPHETYEDKPTCVECAVL